MATHVVRWAALATGVALVGGGWWARRNPTAFRYSARWIIELPHPMITRGRLRGVLAPQAGERILEIGPGTGYYSVAVAEWLAPNGQLDVFDIHQEFLDHTVRAAAERGLHNVVPTQGDARRLPYLDATFDAACMMTVLGEIPDQQTALRELRRVLKPGGRLVIGEFVFDVDWITSRALASTARSAGLRYEQRTGSPLGYFALLRPGS